jgi:hypothetical protein
MKRRIIMGIAAVTAVFATENIVDILVSNYVDFQLEIGVWIVIAAVCAIIVHEVGEDRGDW